MPTFRERIAERTRLTGSCLCIGLDSEPDKLPREFLGPGDPQVEFNRAIIDATKDLAVCYKPNTAFYESRGVKGFAALEQTARYLFSLGIPAIADGKRGDIGNTARQYAKAFLETMPFSAVTVNPYMGEDTIAPFRDYPDAGIFVLCYTSNPSRVDLQAKTIRKKDGTAEAMYQWVARKIHDWDTAKNLGAVVGATAPKELGDIRGILGPDIPILCPGIGAQGGDLEETLRYGEASLDGNTLINVSRSVLFASRGKDFAEAARNKAAGIVDRMRAYFNL
ncbi:MAG TPA: orotidine-5'-phosphate decarboxylase [bacterium]|nr:orotidine-5'-phosphate decarboxylase [bacterium]HQL62992.1 orotidine-5'-phosphate decarboxylase [bacterium]